MTVTDLPDLLDTVDTFYGPSVVVGKLFPLTGPCPNHCGECDQCARSKYYTPRNMEMLHTQARANSYYWRTDVEEGYGTFTKQLPAIADSQPQEWMSRFVHCFDDIADRIENGEVPYPRCTGEEMALHLILDDCAEILALGDSAYEYLIAQELDTVLPHHPDDGDTESLRDVMFEDHDVLMLFNPAFDTTDTNPAAAMLGRCNLEPDTWFLPFRPEEPV